MCGFRCLRLFQGLLGTCLERKDYLAQKDMQLNDTRMQSAKKEVCPLGGVVCEKFSWLLYKMKEGNPEVRQMQLTTVQNEGRQPWCVDATCPSHFVLLEDDYKKTISEKRTIKAWTNAFTCIYYILHDFTLFYYRVLILLNQYVLYLFYSLSSIFLYFSNFVFLYCMVLLIIFLCPPFLHLFLYPSELCAEVVCCGRPYTGNLGLGSSQQLPARHSHAGLLWVFAKHGAPWLPGTILKLIFTYLYNSLHIFKNHSTSFEIFRMN